MNFTLRVLGCVGQQTPDWSRLLLQSQEAKEGREVAFGGVSVTESRSYTDMAAKTIVKHMMLPR